MSRPVNRMRAVHPGEVLREDYLAPLGLSVNALALALGVQIALSGIAAAIILGIGRAVGETMAVMMVAGNAAIIPDPIWNVTEGFFTDLSPLRLWLAMFLNFSVMPLRIATILGLVFGALGALAEVNLKAQRVDAAGDMFDLCGTGMRPHNNDHTTSLLICL